MKIITIFLVFYHFNYIAVATMIIRFVVVFLTFFFCCCCCCFRETVAEDGTLLRVEMAARDLRVEYVSCPVFGVGVARPRFSWSLQHPNRSSFQTSYHLIVTRATVKSDKNDTSAMSSVASNVIWDSGTVNSNATLGVQCEVSLESDSKYIFTVEWSDNQGHTAPSVSGIFTTSLLNQSDWDTSKWLVLPDESQIEKVLFILLLQHHYVVFMYSMYCVYGMNGCSMYMAVCMFDFMFTVHVSFCLPGKPISLCHDSSNRSW